MSHAHCCPHCDLWHNEPCSLFQQRAQVPSLLTMSFYNEPSTHYEAHCSTSAPLWHTERPSSGPKIVRSSTRVYLYDVSSAFRPSAPPGWRLLLGIDQFTSVVRSARHTRAKLDLTLSGNGRVELDLQTLIGIICVPNIDWSGERVQKH